MLLEFENWKELHEKDLQSAFVKSPDKSYNNFLEKEYVAYAAFEVSKNGHKTRWEQLKKELGIDWL